MPKTRPDRIRTPLDPQSIPRAIVGREEERSALNHALREAGQTDNLYLYGPRGTGKTAVVRTVLNGLSKNVTTCYLSCIRHDTQYKILKQLYRLLTGERIGQGYHTAQIQQRIKEQIAGRDIVVVLDEIDFLLKNDGNDLLYYLSRMDNTGNLTVIGISANHPDLSSVIEERTYSSLYPRHISFDTYTQTQAYRILAQRLEEAALTADRAALQYITSQTTNTRLGVHWLAQAAADGQITEDDIRQSQEEAVQRYRNALLNDFTVHHHILLDAVSQLVNEFEVDTAAGTETNAEGEEGARAGLIYDRYHELCEERTVSALTNRRIGDFLTHLELLNIVEATYHSGGKHGKTRVVRIRKDL